MKKLLILFLLLSLNLYAQLSGTYYIGAPGTGPGGSDPHFQTLKAACDTLNANSGNIQGNCTFLITSNLTETSNSGLALNTNGFTITFRPSADEDRTITFTQTSDNTASSGGWVIGLSNVNSWASLVTTNNIIIDGYAEGGSTRRLTLQTASTAHTAHTPIHIVGDVNNVTIKNCNLIVNQTTGTSAFGAVSIRTRIVAVGDERIPDNITVDNCVITTNTPSGAGIFVSFTTGVTNATPSGRPSSLEFKNNIITVRHRAISLNYSGTSSIYNNTISVNQPASGFASFAIGGTSAGLLRTDVYNNKIIQLATGNTAGGTNGIRGIQASFGGPWYIYNNFITGFSTPSTGTTEVVGIRVGSESYIYNNTIVMNNVSTTGGGTTPTSGIGTYTTSCDIRNNIVITEEDDFINYCVYWSSIPTTTNFNNFYRTGTTNSLIGFSGGFARATLLDLQTATSKDLNSVSKLVNFVSATDLHLTGASIGDNDLFALPITGYTTDIDGQTRTWGYKGADEITTHPIPLTNWTVSMSPTANNAQAFGNTSKIGSDEFCDFYATWDATYLYLGWSGGRTNYSSDMYYAAIDIDPDGTNGTTNAIEGVGFLTGGQKPDYYVVYENNSSFYGMPTSDGNAFEVYGVSGGNWSWISRTGGDDGTNSQIVFADGGGEVRLRVPWSALGGFTPGAANKLGIVMWNNNGSGNYMWARVPNSNPAIGETPKTLTNYFRFNSTAVGINPAVDRADVVLPVELVSFTAKAIKNNVELSWSTATEINNYGFEVERSIDKINWNKLGFVAGSGNSNSPKDYSFTDKNPVEGKSYYRLKQIDLDGQMDYSQVIEVEFSNTIPVTYNLYQNYPNPFNPSTTIRYSLPKASDVRLLVYTINGELVKELVNSRQSAGEYNISFDGRELSSGTYIYRIIAVDVNSGENFVQTKKMMLIK